MGVEYKTNGKQNTNWKMKYEFSSLYEIPNKMMHKLVLVYQLKTNQLKPDSHKNSSFSINKICALRYRDIISTNKTYICMKN